MESIQLFHKIKEFQRASRKQIKGLETLCSPGYINKKRTSKFYYVEFLHIFKELEVKTVSDLFHFCGN